MARRKPLSGYTVFIDGVDYIGVATGFTPPTITEATVQSDMPGHGGAFAIPTGRLEELEAMVSMGDQFPELERLVGDPASTETPVLFIGVTTDGETQRKSEYELTGLWTKQERSEFSGAEGGQGGRGGSDRGPCTYTISVRTLTHTIDGEEVRHIDLEQNIHRINGRDVNEALRNALSRSSGQGAGERLQTGL